MPRGSRIRKPTLEPQRGRLHNWRQPQLPELSPKRGTLKANHASNPVPGWAGPGLYIPLNGSLNALQKA